MTSYSFILWKLQLCVDIWCVADRNYHCQNIQSESDLCYSLHKEKVKWSRYRPGVAQRVGRGLAVLFHDHGTRRGWVVSSTPRPHFTPGKDPVPILQEAGWAPGPVWTDGKSRPHRDSIPDRPACSSVTVLTELPSPCYSPRERVNLSPGCNRWQIHLESCVTTCFLCPFQVLWNTILCSKVQQI
jgi:hypothetical protein